MISLRSMHPCPAAHWRRLSGATLTFMAGGEDKAFAAAKPVLELMGKKIVHCGGAGAGQAAKICNNMILGISMIARQPRPLRSRKSWGCTHQGAVRRRLDLVGAMLVADDVLSGAGAPVPTSGRRTTSINRASRQP